MDVVILLVFISLGLVAASLLFFVHRLREGDFDHGERLALAPLEEDPPNSKPDGPDAREANGADGSRTDEHSSEGMEGGSSHARC